MKILYAIQGTGNGHMARALEMVPSLMRHGDVDVLVSGSHCELQLPWPVKYRFNGMGFVFGKQGGIDWRATFKGFRTRQFMADVRRLPVRDYDLVINDFEPVSAYACLLRRVTCVSMSHQAAVLGMNAPRPLTRDMAGWLVMKVYAPVRYAYGFHFERYDAHTFTPVIRRDVRHTRPVDGAHYTVYLPSYGDEAIIGFLGQFPNERFEVFSKHSHKAYQAGNVKIHPVNKELFARSLQHARGVFCNAGFEAPAEALFLGKKLCVIPMHGQYEQQCNAYALEKMGVPVIKRLGQKEASLFRQWLAGDERVTVNYPNETDAVVDAILARHVAQPGQLAGLVSSC
ncbi:MAG: glycosyl transferase [Marinilabiliaceae bacterium]|nr:glycosyl transferase [Marinilabiliaceae bacterium]